MSTRFFQKIQQKERKRQELLSRLFKNKKMVKGSFCQIFVKCGKKNCWCSGGKGHPHKRMTLYESGKNFSRAIPSADYDWIEEMTSNFRDYRMIRRQIAKLEVEVKALLDQYEDHCLKLTKKGKFYLEILEADSEDNCKKSSERQKQRKT